MIKRTTNTNDDCECEKKKKKKPKKINYPQEIIVFENKDKQFQERWYKGRDPVDFPHSHRICMIARPHSGKTLTIKNLILRQYPPYERIMLWSESPLSKEYDCLDVEMFDNCPTPDDIVSELDPDTKQPYKQLLIIDDIDLDHLNKENEINLMKILKHYSSHFNTSVYLTIHDLTQLKPKMRRMCNVFIIWKLSNETLRILGDKFSIPNKTLLNMYNQNVKKTTDNITVDLTTDSPYKYRFNLWGILDEHDYEEK